MGSRELASAGRRRHQLGPPGSRLSLIGCCFSDAGGSCGVVDPYEITGCMGILIGYAYLLGSSPRWFLCRTAALAGPYGRRVITVH